MLARSLGSGTGEIQHSGTMKRPCAGSPAGVLAKLGRPGFPKGMAVLLVGEERPETGAQMASLGYNGAAPPLPTAPGRGAPPCCAQCTRPSRSINSVE